MPFIKGYKYTTEQEAIAVQTECDTFYNLPEGKNNVTMHWVDYNFAELNNPQFYYITFDESLIPILGNPIEFEIIQPPFPI